MQQNVVIESNSCEKRIRSAACMITLLRTHFHRQEYRGDMAFFDVNSSSMFTTLLTFRPPWKGSYQQIRYKIILLTLSKIKIERPQNQRYLENEHEFTRCVSCTANEHKKVKYETTRHKSDNECCMRTFITRRKWGNPPGLIDLFPSTQWPHAPGYWVLHTRRPEARGLTPSGVLPSLAGGEWPGWRDLYCDGGPASPALLSALPRQFRLYIPFLGIVRPQPQFPHSCVYERFTYSQDQSTYFLQQNRQAHRGNI